jgi:nitroreductase
MDTSLAIASKRDIRRYGDRPIPEKVERRILDAGRLAGSARNRQPWRLVMVESTDRRTQLAEGIYAPENVHQGQLMLAIVGSSGLDGGPAQGAVEPRGCSRRRRSGGAGRSTSPDCSGAGRSATRWTVAGGRAPDDRQKAIPVLLAARSLLRPLRLRRLLLVGLWKRLLTLLASHAPLLSSSIEGG